MTLAELQHYGILRKSGRYPWGSGENPYQRSKGFAAYIQELKAKGLSDKQIRESLPVLIETGKDKGKYRAMTTTELRAHMGISSDIIRREEAAIAKKLRYEKKWSNTAIAAKLGVSEGTVRNYLKATDDDRKSELFETASVLKDRLKDGGYLDISSGTENHMGVANSKLKTAVAVLEDEGYTVHYIKVEQLGNPGKFTSMKILAPPGTKWQDVNSNKDKIKAIGVYSDDGGSSYTTIKTPVAVDPKRVAVRYGPDGGSKKDGVIELRRGVEDLDLGNARYAQVRIQVGKDRFLKGMAVYSDDMPPGVDILFNTDKRDTGNKLDAMKPLESDPQVPFKSIVRQKEYVDSNGKVRQSALNIVGAETPDGGYKGKTLPKGEEGAWSEWSATLSSQMLSKQDPELARKQLGIAQARKQAEFDEINSLTNPVVKKVLLQKFADSADSAAKHLKAAALPRTANHVILPINSLKDNEVYAPNYKNGERVVLIRHPHGGVFEIPELTVNNNNREANAIIKNAVDAVGINANVAARLSGADFDGDTVLVIPQRHGTLDAIKTSPPLEGLKDFNPKNYKLPEGKTFKGDKQKMMGTVSNLITDMTIKNASESEIARAVRHSMVVIDAEKHNLDWRQSEIDNGIKDLQIKYQAGPEGRAGASTIVSRAKSPVYVNERKARSSKEGGPIDPKTGEKKWTETGASYEKMKKVDGKWVGTGKVIPRTTKSTQMAEAKDAYSLSSGTVMEGVYADYANAMKSLANQARKEYLATKTQPYSKTARETYRAQVDSLSAKLNEALKNSPRERQAQILANTILDAKKQANPKMDRDDIKRESSRALADARARVGAKKERVYIDDLEWEAIQSGAVTKTMQEKLFENADLERVKELATPRAKASISPAIEAKINAMAARGYTQAEIAEAVGVSSSTVNNVLA